MSKAQSFQSEPWTALEKGSWSIFQDDFINEKLTYKFTRKGYQSTVALKNSISFKDGKINKNQGQVKFWFPFGRNTLYGRLKNDSYKLHLDNGIYKYDDFNVNIYGSVQGKRALGGDNIKFGIETRKDDWSNNLRVGFFPAEKGAIIYNKTSYSFDNWKFGFVNAFQLIANQWNYSAMQVKWQDKKGNDYYLRTNAGSNYQKICPIDHLNNVTANFIYKYNPNNNLGCEFSGTFIKRIVNNFAVAWDHKCADNKNTGIKVKADIHRNVAVALKNNIQNYGSYVFGINIRDFGGANVFSYGLQIDFDFDEKNKGQNV